jgi:predicted DNA-binding protein
MPAATTTIRVSADTRDRLRALSAREGESAGEIVARLVRAADDERLLAEMQVALARLVDDPKAFAAYRHEVRELQAGFDAPAPGW